MSLNVLYPLFPIKTFPLVEQSPQWFLYLASSCVYRENDGNLCAHEEVDEAMTHSPNLLLSLTGEEPVISTQRTRVQGLAHFSVRHLKLEN